MAAWSGRAITLDPVTVAHLIERVVAPLGRRIDRSSPIVDARLPGGARVHAVVPPLAVDGPCLSIRRFAARSLPLAAFAVPEVVTLLDDVVSAGANVLVSGPTSSGKTTLLNALAGRAARGRAHHHDRGCGRAAAARRPRRAAGGPAAQPRRRGRGHDPGARAGCAAHAPRSARRRRGPRVGGARHADGHEHGPRRLARHLPCQRLPRRAPPPGGHGAPGRRPAAASRPRSRRRGDRRRRPRRSGLGGRRRVVEVVEVRPAGVEAGPRVRPLAGPSGLVGGGLERRRRAEALARSRP